MHTRLIPKNNKCMYVFVRWKIFVLNLFTINGQRPLKTTACTFKSIIIMIKNVIISANIDTNKKKPRCPVPPSTVDAAPHKITPNKSQN